MWKSGLYGRGRYWAITALVCFPFLLSSCREQRKNRLSRASSPYLRAQADDPVDWYEWGNEALDKAKRENKPLLISIGYSACHWCHVMEKETFSDSAVARIMNRYFVCIKVDREERPDVDKVYSEACQIISGSSGWPLNAFALADGKPFFAGTYYSKKSWTNLLDQIVTACRSQANKVDLQAQTLAAAISDSSLPSFADSHSPGIGRSSYQGHFEEVYRKMDLSYGGVTGTPKFPMTSAIEFLLQYYSATGDKRALNVATNTLTKMALGGIYDQVGGGFARYAADSEWHIPHFEKMLCDNAALLTAYAHAYQLTQDDLFKDIVRGIAAFVERELGRGDGSYYSTLNADTKAGEGEYYAWSAGELKKHLGDGYGLIADYYSISDDGNWKPDRNILFAAESPLQFAQSRKIDPRAFSSRLEVAKQRLLSARNGRERPSVDMNILTSWNALLLKGYLDAYAAIGDPGLFQQALKTARFLEKNMLLPDGMLLHSRKGGGTPDGGIPDGATPLEGFLDDYAFLASAYLRMYEVTFEKHWLDLAKRLAGRVNGRFFDAGTGLFFYTGRGQDTVVIRKIEIADDNMPSSNAVMAEVLYKLGSYFEMDDYLNRSAQMLSRVNDVLSRRGALYYAKWCCLEGLAANGMNEVAIVGKNAVDTGLAIQKRFLPFCLFLGSAGKEDLPLLEGKGGTGRKEDGDRTWIYICTNKVCKRPVTTAMEANRQLSAAHGR